MQSILRKNIEDLEGYTPGEQPKQADLIKLNTNENPYPPSPRVLAAVRKEITSSLRLYPDPMALELRKRAAALYRRRAGERHGRQRFGRAAVHPDALLRG